MLQKGFGAVRVAAYLVFVFATVTSAVVAFSTVASAQEQEADKVRAKQMFEQGVSQYESARFAEALESFQEAYRLKPHPLVRVNIANCYDKLGRPVEAVFNFELFLESGAGSAAQKSEIKEALKTLKKRIGKLVLLVSPDGARVKIDDADERVAPINEPIALEAGKHKVVAELDGYETAAREVEVKGEATTEVSLRLLRTAAVVTPAPVPAIVPDAEPAAEPVVEEEEPAPAPLAAESEPADEPSEAPDEATEDDAGIPASVWIAGGVTLAFAVAGTITGVVTNAAEQNFEDNLRARFDPLLTAKQQAIAWDNAQESSNAALALAITTDALFAASIVGAGITAYLYLTRNEGSDDLALAPSLTPTTAALTARGRF